MLEGGALAAVEAQAVIVQGGAYGQRGLFGDTLGDGQRPVELLTRRRGHPSGASSFSNAGIAMIPLT